MALKHLDAKFFLILVLPYQLLFSPNADEMSDDVPAGAGQRNDKDQPDLNRFAGEDIDRHMIEILDSEQDGYRGQNDGHDRSEHFRPQ